MLYNTETKLYGVIGHPVKHSSSPLLFNEIFQYHRYQGVYLAFERENVADLIQGMRQLNVSGFSVTIPFKEEVMPYLDEIDESAQILGCANTISNQDGKLVGFNYDGLGALAGLENFFSSSSRTNNDLSPVSPTWHHHKIVLLGNGGAARGILLTIANQKQFQGDIFIIARNLEKSQILVDKIQQLNPRLRVITETFANLSQLANTHFQEDSLIINTTPMGMYPHTDASPVPPSFFNKTMVAYDIVYNPTITKFLQQAQDQDANIITGVNMFLGQARLQLKQWTSLDLTMSEMNQHYQNALKSKP